MIVAGCVAQAEEILIDRENYIDAVIIRNLIKK